MEQGLHWPTMISYTWVATASYVSGIWRILTSCILYLGLYKDSMIPCIKCFSAVYKPYWHDDLGDTKVKRLISVISLRISVAECFLITMVNKLRYHIARVYLFYCVCVSCLEWNVTKVFFKLDIGVPGLKRMIFLFDDFQIWQYIP